MLSPFILSQVAAAAAFAMGITAFQMHERQRLLTFMVMAALLNSLHFFLLEQVTAGCLILVIAIRFITAKVSMKPYLKYVFVALTSVAFLATVEGWLQVLPYVATCAGSVGAFEEKVGRVRGFLAFGSTCWLVHNGIVGTPVGIAMEATFLVSNVVGVIRSRRAVLKVAS